MTKQVIAEVVAVMLGAILANLTTGCWERGEDSKLSPKSEAAIKSLQSALGPQIDISASVNSNDILQIALSAGQNVTGVQRIYVWQKDDVNYRWIVDIGGNKRLHLSYGQQTDDDVQNSIKQVFPKQGLPASLDLKRDCFIRIDVSYKFFASQGMEPIYGRYKYLKTKSALESVPLGEPFEEPRLPGTSVPDLKRSEP